MLTQELLTAKGVCVDGFAWFVERFKDGTQSGRSSAASASSTDGPRVLRERMARA